MFLAYADQLCGTWRSPEVFPWSEGKPSLEGETGCQELWLIVHVVLGSGVSSWGLIGCLHSGHQEEGVPISNAHKGILWASGSLDPREG